MNNNIEQYNKFFNELYYNTGLKISYYNQINGYNIYLDYLNNLNNKEYKTKISISNEMINNKKHNIDFIMLAIDSLVHNISRYIMDDLISNNRIIILDKEIPIKKWKFFLNEIEKENK